jgi:O-antigen/teichoic acid export membrane protein
MLTAVSVRIPIFMVGIGSLSAAGTYEIAQRIQGAGALGVSSVGSVYLPAVRVALHKRDNKQLFKSIVFSAALSLLLPSFFLCLLLLTGEQLMTRIFPTSYTGLWLAAILLLVSASINATTSPLSSLLSMNGNARQFLYACAAQVAVFVAAVAGFGLTSPVQVASAVVIGEVIRSSLLVLFSFFAVRKLSRTTPKEDADGGTVVSN